MGEDQSQNHRVASIRGGGRKAVVAAMDAVVIAKKMPEDKRQAVLAAANEQITKMAQRGDAAPKIKIYDRYASRPVPITAPTLNLHRAQDRTAPTRSQ